jgi:hypothetical protein
MLFCFAVSQEWQRHRLILLFSSLFHRKLLSLAIGQSLSRRTVRLLATYAVSAMNNFYETPKAALPRPSG